MSKAWLKAGINVSFSVACLYFLQKQISWHTFIEIFADLDAIYWYGALGLILALSMPQTKRWQLAALALKESLPFSVGMRWIFVGYFFNQLLPTSFGGDIFRAWGLHKRGVKLIKAVSSVLLDRISAVVTLFLMFGCTYPWVRSQIQWVGLDVLLGITLALIIGLLVFFRWRRAIGQLIVKTLPFEKLKDVGHLMIEAELSAGQWVALVTYSVIMHTLLSSAYYVLAQGLEIPISFWLCLAIFPISNLVTLIPISFAGWGVREGTFMFILSFAGITATQAFSLSISVGIVTTLAATPGLIAWFGLPKGLQSPQHEAAH